MYVILFHVNPLSSNQKAAHEIFESIPDATHRQIIADAAKIAQDSLERLKSLIEAGSKQVLPQKLTAALGDVMEFSESLVTEGWGGNAIEIKTAGENFIDHESTIAKCHEFEMRFREAGKPVLDDVNAWLIGLEGKRIRTSEVREILDSLASLALSAGGRFFYSNEPVKIYFHDQGSEAATIRVNLANTNKPLWTKVKFPELKIFTQDSIQ